MTGLIRKIVVGRDPKNGMAYYLGMEVGRNKVSAIVFDEEHLVRYHKERYLVYVEDESGVNTLWKCISECSTVCEYDLNF